MQTYPVSVIAKLLNLSERRVQQLSKDGVIPKADKGKYPLVESVQAYVKYLYDRAYGQNNESIDSHVEKARLLKAQATKAELELAVMENNYYQRSEIEFLWSGMVLAFRSKILSLPTKLVRPLAEALSDFAKIERILEYEIHQALTELSKYQHEETGYTEDRTEGNAKYTEQSHTESSPETSTTSEVESKRVGGSLSAAIK